ncbi:hypothetical protein HK100_006277 [Physocladia obscura]|uniref:Uncharacterized protein n=1 Tax=Physocladia obscura TaxID=109957 RepID=A0AAD5X8W0_9FUNG|nr:hypothetical protein HK100_006277 [Physocladia obscura]
MPEDKKAATGRIEVVCDGDGDGDGSTSDVRALSFAYPLRLISASAHPANRRHRSVYVLGHGGGVLQTDHTRLSVRVAGRGASLALLTQGNTKIYKSNSISSADTNSTTAAATVVPAHTSRADVHARVSGGALLCVLPDPVTPFRGASHLSSQVVELADHTASLLFLDWASAGRVHYRDSPPPTPPPTNEPSTTETSAVNKPSIDELYKQNERWDFASVQLRARISVAAAPVFRDRLVLDTQALKALRVSSNNTNCVLTLVLIGPRTATIVDHIQQRLKETAAAGGGGGGKKRVLGVQDPLWSYSPLAPSDVDYSFLSEAEQLRQKMLQNGGVVRAVASSVLVMRAFVKDLIKDLHLEIGEDLFSHINDLK